MLKTSTEIASLSALVGEHRAVEMIAKAGFDAWDFSLFDMCRWDWENNRPKDIPHPLRGKDYLAFARELRHIGEECGIVCNQSHAPFPSAPMFEWLVRSIECTAEAGGKICVIHPVNTHSAEENAEMYEKLLPYAKDAGIQIATENMWNWNFEKNEAAPAACSDPESFLAHLRAVNDPDLVACLDLGHAEMRGLNTTAPEMIRALGGHLQALHVHDNDRHDDSHQIPFSMDMDWDAIATALRDIRYEGYITLEANAYLTAYTKENAEIGVRKLAESARRLARMVAGESV